MGRLFVFPWPVAERPLAPICGDMSFTSPSTYSQRCPSFPAATNSCQLKAVLVSTTLLRDRTLRHSAIPILHSSATFRDAGVRDLGYNHVRCVGPKESESLSLVFALFFEPILCFQQLPRFVPSKPLLHRPRPHHKPSSNCQPPYDPDGGFVFSKHSKVKGRTVRFVLSPSASQLATH
jgi:hypothetical protein